MDRILIILKKRKWASSVPALGLNTIIFKHVYWYSSRSQVSVYRTIGPLVSSSERTYCFCSISSKNSHFELLEDLWCEIQTEELQDVQTRVCIFIGNENNALVSPAGMSELYTMLLMV